MKNKLVWLYPPVLFLYSIYSYSQTTPNLVLSSNRYFWQFQLWMWQLGYHNRPVSTLIFILLIVMSFGFYGLILKLVRDKLMTVRQMLVLFALCITALLPSYPALSNDIYNYLMNAKMMHLYKASPYTHTALDFPDDPWPKFMMNVHTTTPYGYVWTGLGYAAYLMGLGDLQFGMLMLRGLAILAVAVIGWSIWTIRKKQQWEAVAYFIFNPLVLFEAVNNTHNDIAMMAFLVGGIAVFTKLWPKKKWQALIVLAVTWLLSVYTKLVTVISPFVVSGYYIIRKYIPWFNWADLLTLALIVVMYADGAKRFFSWYLLWALAVVPLAQSYYTKKLMIFFSLTGMLSYVFYLYTGMYNKELGDMRIGLLFIVPAVYTVFRIAAVTYRKLV